MDIVLTRSFNHIGTGQKEIFVISSFAKKLVEIKKTNSKNAEIHTGDLKIIRDFLDVRDVVKAYYLLLKDGKSGEIYNICSNEGIALGEILQKMIDYLDIEVKIIIDPSFIRPNDNEIIIGNNSKLKSATGWNKEIELDQSLKDIIQYWEQNNNSNI